MRDPGFAALRLEIEEPQSESDRQIGHHGGPYSASETTAPAFGAMSSSETTDTCKVQSGVRWTPGLFLPQFIMVQPASSRKRRQDSARLPI